MTATYTAAPSDVYIHAQPYYINKHGGGTSVGGDVKYHLNPDQSLAGKRHNWGIDVYRVNRVNEHVDGSVASIWGATAKDRLPDNYITQTAFTLVKGDNETRLYLPFVAHRDAEGVLSYAHGPEAQNPYTTDVNLPPDGVSMGWTGTNNSVKETQTPSKSNDHSANKVKPAKSQE